MENIKSLSLFDQKQLFSNRVEQVPRSFIREILKVASNPDMISFAGGLPNAKLFPVEQLKDATTKVFNENPAEALQYSNSEGYAPLRQYISNYYLKHHNLKINPDTILITCGSQQGLDLIAKVLINKGDEIIIEEPGYLGAIQALSFYQPVIKSVTLNEEGPDINFLRELLTRSNPKLMYTVPQFQNPSGLSYSESLKLEIASIFEDKNIFLVEDNPYIDIRFNHKKARSFYSYIPEKTILLGTFSKIAVPGFRLGWVVASGDLFEKLLIAKQAADLHTNIFTQIVLYKYLQNNPIERHISEIVHLYKKQKDAMISAIDYYFGGDLKYTNPEGGMFLWAQLPEGYSAMELFNLAIKKAVAFVPGDPFYCNTGEKVISTMRMNFSCADEETIYEGIARIAQAYKELIS